MDTYIRYIGTHSDYERVDVELELLSNLVSEYEEVYLTVNPPTLPEILRLRMAEMGRKLAIDPHILLGV